MVDTFSGIGGFSLAAEWTGRIRPVQFIEIDPWCRRVLAKHWPGVPIHDDIKTFLADAEGAGLTCRGGECGDATPGEVGFANTVNRRLDLITGGFPCQPFSQAGKQRGAHDDRYLWPELARVVAALRPRWCLFENVFGIVNMAGGLERVWADLEADGYEVGAVVIPAAAIGAPHKRDRVWIVARDMADTGREGCPAGGVRGGAAAQGEVLDLGLADGSNSRRGADVSEPDALGRGWWQDDKGQAPAERDGHPQAGDVADAASDGSQQRHQPDLLGRWAGDAEQTGMGGLGTELATAECGGGERGVGPQTLSGMGGEAHGLPGFVDGRFAPRPFGPDWEDGVPRVTTHEEDRVSKLKALGNSIVPQVAYELMLMMLAVDDEAN